MKTYGEAIRYKKLLKECYGELRELQDWGLPLPRLYYDYYDYLLEMIVLVRSLVTQVTD